MTDQTPEHAHWSKVAPLPAAELVTPEIIALVTRVSAEDDPGEWDELDLVAATSTGSADADAWFKAADAGDASAMCMIAAWLVMQALLGSDDAAGLYETAEQWLCHAITLGSARACGDLGFVLIDCHEGVDDHLLGMCLLRIAAVAGNTIAMRNLGIVLTGEAEEGIEVDEAEGVVWLARAAKAGDYLAQEITAEG